MGTPGHGRRRLVLLILLSVSLLFLAMTLPAFLKARERARRLWCYNYMMQVVSAFKRWSLDHGGEYPFNVSTNQGGTLELCRRGSDGFEQDSTIQFSVLSNELSTPFVLVCPDDSSRHAAADWAHLQAANLTYRVHSGPEVNETNSQAVLAYCPIHGIACLCEGTVQYFPQLQRHPGKR